VPANFNQHTSTKNSQLAFKKKNTQLAANNISITKAKGCGFTHQAKKIFFFFGMDAPKIFEEHNV